MDYQLKDINDAVLHDPEAYARACDDGYQQKVVKAADLISKNMNSSPIVLLSGPSGSGKTTMALKIQEELNSRGIRAHTISLDKYFRTLNVETAPHTPDGELDYESPECLDMDLLNEHFSMLSEGREIRIPHFVFAEQRRSETKSTPLKLEKNEIAIFEGIHALNDDITQTHPEAFKLYVSARSNIRDGDKPVFKGTWMRLTRRVVRDLNFRGADAAFTLSLWANVRRGEKLYISPFKDRADYKFDSTLPYEVCVLKQYAKPLFEKIPLEIDRVDELKRILPAFEEFADMDDKYVLPNALIREFIGGGSYKY